MHANACAASSCARCRAAEPHRAAATSARPAPIPIPVRALLQLLRQRRHCSGRPAPPVAACLCRLLGAVRATLRLHTSSRGPSPLARSAPGRSFRACAELPQPRLHLRAAALQRPSSPRAKPPRAEPQPPARALRRPRQHRGRGRRASAPALRATLGRPRAWAAPLRPPSEPAEHLPPPGTALYQWREERGRGKRDTSLPVKGREDQTEEEQREKKEE
jgi:hypothetical protein